eukprot:9783085-Prorocentrum_lima.AAC.1
MCHASHVAHVWRRPIHADDAAGFCHACWTDQLQERGHVYAERQPRSAGLILQLAHCAAKGRL